MRILISNDDGYFSPGITALAEALRSIGEVTVVAPERDRSGASNSLTLDRPLNVRQAANGFYFVNGTPTDCVHLAVTGLLDVLPDMIVSGINLGANMGDDTIYSGTVAAATEGFLLGIPSLAVSLASKEGRHLSFQILGAEAENQYQQTEQEGERPPQGVEQMRCQHHSQCRDADRRGGADCPVAPAEAAHPRQQGVEPVEAAHLFQRTEKTLDQNAQ